jgi:hypothetical protein
MFFVTTRNPWHVVHLKVQAEKVSPVHSMGRGFVGFRSTLSTQSSL